MWKQRGFFDHRNYIEKSMWKQYGFFGQRNYIEKSTWKQRGFFNQQMTSKKYVEMTWKFVEIWFSMYRRNIRSESTSIRRGGYSCNSSSISDYVNTVEITSISTILK